MGRTPLIRSDYFAYHVTARCNNKDWFYIPLEEVWAICLEKWLQSHELYRFYIHSFVLMSNHFHLIISTPDKNLDLIMRYFQTETAKAICRLSDRINHVFGGRYKWSLLTSSVALAYAFKYLHRNPVRAEICQRVEDYPFNAHLRDFPLVEGIDSYWSLIPQDQRMRSLWLNSPTPKELESLVGKALNRSEFQFTYDNNYQKKIRELHRSYGISDAPATF